MRWERVAHVGAPTKRKKAKRKNPRTSTQRPATPALFDLPEECDCPACTGAEPDLDQLLDPMAAAAAELYDADDPLDAEILAAMVLATCPSQDEDAVSALVDGLIPALERRADRGSLTLLLAIGAVAPDPGGPAAAAAAGRLAAAGLPVPSWAGELDEPVTVADCSRLRDTAGTAAVLTCSFHRAGRAHAVVISVDHLDCGAAGEIALLEAERLPETLEALVAEAHDPDAELLQERLEPSEFRWHVQNALAARAVHDSDDSDDSDAPAGPDLGDEDDAPTYSTMATLLRARMSALPAPTRAPAPHPADASRTPETVMRLLAQLAGHGPAGRPSLPGAAVRPLPKKRGKADRPAPGYQIKVGLRGAKPPIWRRLEVPADISLARLHEVIQLAFGWEGYHLHAFSTPYGDFGDPDPELGHRAEAPVTLEQVAPTVRDKITYVYDFGDDWTHDIVVEKVLDRDGPTRLRCTGGRRAAPPEDCGGIWGYADLVESLADPPEFDPAEVTSTLELLR